MTSTPHQQVAMTDTEGKRETGASLIFIGLAIWVVDFLVVFFLPSGIKLGRQGTFLNIILALGVLGLALLIIGYRARGKSSGE
jgi:hypothetical protein